MPSGADIDAESESRALCAAAQRDAENQSPLVRASGGPLEGRLVRLVLQVVLRRGVRPVRRGVKLVRWIQVQMGTSQFSPSLK